jgi:hypothetical protein
MNSFIVTSHLHTSFRKIGAFVQAVPQPVATRPRRGPVAGPRRINVRDRTFELTLTPDTLAVVSDCRPDERHLVLNLQNPGSKPERFLCGFDERHWFVAAVKGTTVSAAKDSLMPRAVRTAAEQAHLRRADFQRRHTSAFIRQGEWFFVPAGIDVDPLRISRREPLVRPGGGKPHIVDELVRGTGEMVWHHARHAPDGINDAQRAALPKLVRSDVGWSRRLRVLREGSVLARGAVRHPDHATIYLAGWHRVYINSEVRPVSLGFLD